MQMLARQLLTKGQFTKSEVNRARVHVLGAGSASRVDFTFSESVLYRQLVFNSLRILVMSVLARKGVLARGLVWSL